MAAARKAEIIPAIAGLCHIGETELGRMCRHCVKERERVEPDDLETSFLIQHSLKGLVIGCREPRGGRDDGWSKLSGKRAKTDVRNIGDYDLLGTKGGQSIELQCAGPTRLAVLQSRQWCPRSPDLRLLPLTHL